MNKKPTKLHIVPLAHTDISPDPRNARRHPERNLRQIAASLHRYGQQKPIIVRPKNETDDAFGVLTPFVTVAGAGTLVAMRRLDEGFYDGQKFMRGASGRGQYSTIEAVVTTLEGKELTAYAIGDNQTALTSEWDWQELSLQIGELKELEGDAEFTVEMDSLGFEDFDLVPLLATKWQPAAQTDAPSTPQAAGAIEAASSAPPVQPSSNAKAKDPHPDLEEGDRADDKCSIICTPNQRITIDNAIERLRLVCGELSLTEGRCMELIAADYLSGAPLPDHLISDE